LDSFETAVTFGDAMREQLIQLVEKYIDAVRRNDAPALPLHPDAVCEFPTNFGG
jgi:hypothetical protein